MTDRELRAFLRSEQRKGYFPCDWPLNAETLAIVRRKINRGWGDTVKRVLADNGIKCPGNKLPRVLV